MRALPCLPLAVVIGCSSTPAPETPTATTPAAEATADNDLNALYDADGRPIAGRSTTLAQSSPADRYQVHAISEEPTAPKARPARVGKRDIRLHRAGIDSAFRLLAHEGRFNLVVQGDLTKPVTLELQSVEPYDALLALAAAHGIEVDYRGNIVIVSKR